MRDKGTDSLRATERSNNGVLVAVTICFIILLYCPRDGAITELLATCRPFTYLGSYPRRQCSVKGIYLLYRLKKKIYKSPG